MYLNNLERVTTIYSQQQQVENPTYNIGVVTQMLDIGDLPAKYFDFLFRT